MVTARFGDCRRRVARRMEKALRSLPAHRRGSPFGLLGRPTSRQRVRNRARARARARIRHRPARDHRAGRQGARSALRLLASQEMLDVGTGSGILALVALSSVPPARAPSTWMPTRSKSRRKCESQWADRRMEADTSSLSGSKHLRNRHRQHRGARTYSDGPRARSSCCEGRPARPLGHPRHPGAGRAGAIRSFRAPRSASRG